jgi:hypothetical protein
MNFDILTEWIQIYLCTDEPREKKWKRMVYLFQCVPDV